MAGHERAAWAARGEAREVSPSAQRVRHAQLNDDLGNRGTIRLLRARRRDALEGGRDLGRFPHQPELESALGTAIRGRALRDPGGCAARGVLAFTDGDVSHFATESPTIEVAAHEAAHVAQHAGAARDAHLGAEGHAEAVASAVVAGRSARNLIGPRGDAVGANAHDYTRVKQKKQSPGNWEAGGTILVSNDGRMAVRAGTKEAWAEPSLIENASKQLEAVGSDIRLHPAWISNLEGNAPDGSGHRNLAHVFPENLTEGQGLEDQGANMKIMQACISAAGEVLGAGSNAEKEKALTGVYHLPHSALYAFLKAWSGKELPEPAGSYEHTTAASSPQEIASEIAGEQGSLSDETLGINQYADPKVGQAFAINYSGKMGLDDYPGHVAGVIMKSGGDYDTLEAFRPTNDIHGPHVTTNWHFDMYGSKEGETFYDDWKEDYGANPTTMVVAKK